MSRFVDYALAMNRRLGDRVAAITTHNEPWVIAVLGHEQGNFAPGLKSRKTALQVAHHLLVSHGMAVQALRADGCRSQLGIVLNLSPMVPATDSPQDHAAALKADAAGRRWYTDPLFLGAYPQEVMAELGADAPIIHPGDMAHIAAPIDYLGVNYYTRQVISAGEPFDNKTSGLPLTEMGWEVYARGLTDLLLLLHKDYQLPDVLITENGGAFRDPLVDGRVQDADRVDYLRTHIAAVADARDQGVPMRGYMVWSLMDNFEWSSGYTKRFGIVHVDYATQTRTLKDSALWYRDFLRAYRGPQPVGAGA
jgi:beta-glucosidase